MSFGKKAILQKDLRKNCWTINDIFYLILSHNFDLLISITYVLLYSANSENKDTLLEEKIHNFRLALIIIYNIF